jgi:DNA repair protein RadC
MPLTSINIYTLKLVKHSASIELSDCHLTCPLACYKMLQQILDLKSSPSERFGVIALNTKNKIVGIHIISEGSLDEVHVEPREVYKAALLNNARSIIAFHNHPSGDPSPSSEDVAITHRLKNAGKLLCVELLDHMITGEDSYTSLRECGIL